MFDGENIANELMALVIALIMSVNLISTFVNAQSMDYCQDNKILVHVRSTAITVPEINRSRTLQSMENETCPWGCNVNQCRSPPWIVYAIIFGLVVVGSIVVFTMAKGNGEG